MNTKKKIVALAMSLLVLCGTVTSAFAANVVNGTSYQTVWHRDIPGGGGENYDTYYGSKKMTTGKLATFKKLHGDAMLGNFAELIDSNKKYKSAAVGIPLNQAILAQEVGCSKGSTYFSGVISSYIEPSNTCDVRLQFSADNLK